MNASLEPIICCGFTPCIQRIIEFKILGKGEVNRASRVTIGMGGKGANTARMLWKSSRPGIEAVNPVGSGDAVTAGMAVELSRGKDVSEAIVTGMACGAANALTLVSGLLKPDDVERLRSEVQIKAVHSR